jgi:hypothetical protein
MPKYTKFTRKKYMKKYKRGRSKKGGYWLYPGPGDDVHAFESAYTSLKDRVSSFVPSVPNLNPLSYFGKDTPMADAPDAVDYAPATSPAYAADPVDELPVEQPDGQLEYPPDVAAAAADVDAATANVAAADADADAAAADVAAADANADAANQAGGRRRRRRRTTKKRKRSNKRKRTMKRRRSMRRHR